MLCGPILEASEVELDPFFGAANDFNIRLGKQFGESIPDRKAPMEIIYIY